MCNFPNPSPLMPQIWHADNFTMIWNSSSPILGTIPSAQQITKGFCLDLWSWIWLTTMGHFLIRDKLTLKTCTMDGARNVNSAIHFIRIPWIIRSDNDENMKYFTKRSLKFFSRNGLSMVTIPAAIYKFKVIVELSRDRFTHVYLESFSACAWKQPERRQNIYHSFKTFLFLGHFILRKKTKQTVCGYRHYKEIKLMQLSF